MNSLPKTVTRQRRDCDLNPDLSEPESSTLTTRLPSHLRGRCPGEKVRSHVVLGMCRDETSCPRQQLNGGCIETLTAHRHGRAPSARYNACDSLKVYIECWLFID